MPTSQTLLSREHRGDDESPPSADDPAEIRLLALPDVGPPFDDDPAAKAIAAAAIAGPGAETPSDDGPGARTPGARDVPRAHPGTQAPRAGNAKTDPEGGASHAAHPDARPAADVGGTDGEWARRFAVLLTEALSGARPVRQVLPWTSRRARVQLPALMPLFSGGQRPRVLRVIATRPAQDVIEMTVVAGIGGRTRALAVRLQRADPAERPAWRGQSGTRPGRATTARTQAMAPWVCTDIEAA
ncbi:MAG TPA: Rv3235 family protein [Trebonia sp.]|jgi:hypothetical protein